MPARGFWKRRITKASQKFALDHTLIWSKASCTTGGNHSDYIGVAALLGSLPKAGWLLADRGHVADWFREALKDKGIKVCIPGRKSRKKAVKYDKRRYKRRNRIEIMFGRLKRTGGASPRDTTGARKRSSPRSCSPQPYCSGFETQ